MPFDLWISFCVTETVLCLIPGPAVLFVVSTALVRGSRPGLLASLGVLTANSFYFLLSALGVGAAIVASRELFLVLKWAGAAYLIFLGVKMIASRPGTDEGRAPASVSRSFLRGLLVQGANPKALAFFTALLPQFVDPSLPVAPQIAILGISSVVIEFMVLAGYAVATVRGRDVTGGRFSRVLPKLGGAFLIGAGVKLAAVQSE